MKSGRQKIAVVGAGAAGIAASYLLSSKHEVTLFESSESLGGHAHNESLLNEEGVSFKVDTAFLIFNEATYPNFLKFIDCLGVADKSIPAEMSSCFSDSSRDFHFALGGGWAPLLSQPKRYLRSELLRIFCDLVLFRRRANADLRSGKDLTRMTAAQYLSSYSRVFVENFVMPLTSAIWSLPVSDMSCYPILPLLKYFDNHQLLSGRSEKRWRTFLGSSAVYTEAFQKAFSGRICLGTKVQRVDRTAEGVQLTTSLGAQLYDHIVMATHADVSLKILATPTANERQLLGAWQYKDNPVTLHSDSSILYQDPSFWSSWNMAKKGTDYQISYYLNRLQRLPTRQPIILTLGELEVNAGELKRCFNYRHPIFDEKSVATQSLLSSLNGADRISFCGSYFGFGFHEDAIRSAADVAKNFGLEWGDLKSSQAGAR